VKQIAAFFERDLRLALAYPYGVVVPFASIAITVAGFAFLSRLVNPQTRLSAVHEPLTYFSYVVLNFAFMLLLNGAVQAVATAVRRDQLTGTLEAILATPTTLGQVVLGSTLWPVTFCAIQAAFYIFCGFALGMRVGRFDAPAFVAVLILSMICMTAIGALGAAVVVRYKQNPPSSLLVGGAATMLSGALFPVALLPPALRAVSWALPLTHALNGLRGATAGEGIAALGPELVWLAAATLLLMPISLAVFTRAITAARKDGTLASY
jgi:ABC-2 type transport system permease protein